jgi:hypothetical protein
MSLELHALLPGSTIPARAEWQAAIQELGFAVELHADLAPAATAGFTACKLRGVDSGFELYVDDAAGLLSTYPSLGAASPSASIALTFRWGTDLASCACVSAAAAGLLSRWKAVVYYPDDDMFYDLDSLKSDFHACLLDLE